MKHRENPKSQSFLHLYFSFHESRTVSVQSVTFFSNVGLVPCCRKSCGPGHGNGGEAGGVKTDDSVGVKHVGRKQGLDGSSR